ncbi:hypothetical protein UT300012_22460 [Paraclostridium bifermentans]
MNNKYKRLCINGVYRHFKGNIEGEPALYLLSALVKPIPGNIDKCDLKELKFIREDTGELISIYKTGENYFYEEKDMNGVYVIYTALYGNRLTYIRNIDVFLSSRDKVKHPNYDQEYRFELVAKLNPIGGELSDKDRR